MFTAISFLPSAEPESDTSSELQGASFSNEKLVRVRRRGFQVRARVGCPEGAVESCKITLLFKSNVNTRLLASRAARAAKKNVTLGKRKLNVPAGATWTVKVALSKPGRKVFSNTDTLRGVKVILRARDEQGRLPAHHEDDRHPDRSRFQLSPAVA